MAFIKALTNNDSPHTAILAFMPNLVQVATQKPAQKSRHHESSHNKPTMMIPRITSETYQTYKKINYPAKTKHY